MVGLKAGLAAGLAVLFRLQPQMDWTILPKLSSLGNNWNA